MLGTAFSEEDLVGLPRGTVLVVDHKDLGEIRYFKADERWRRSVDLNKMLGMGSLWVDSKELAELTQGNTARLGSVVFESILHHKVPEKKTAGAAGYDCYARVSTPLVVRGVVRVPLGFRMAVPKNVVGVLQGRSSLYKKGLHVLPGIIDSDYRGEIHAVVTALSDNVDAVVLPGQRFCQLVLMTTPVVATPLEGRVPRNTARDEGGFGSTD